MISMTWTLHTAIHVELKTLSREKTNSVENFVLAKWKIQTILVTVLKFAGADAV